jgi:lipopolysaccharide heptosyltransferase II
MAHYRNILIIKPGAIGDLLQMTPVIRALKLMMPEARITILVASTVSVDLFRYNDDVSACIVYDKRGEHQTLPMFWQLWRRIRVGCFDLVLNYQRSNLKAWLLAAATFPSRVLVYHKPKNRVVHAVMNHLETVAPLGIDPAAADHRLKLIVGAEADAYADELFRSHGFADQKVIALNPGANHPVNRWDPLNFARLADRLPAEFGAKVIIIGGKEDIALAEEIGRSAVSSPVSLAGRTSLLELGAILKRCSLLVTGDTGPMHMATAVNTRVIALFGAADPARTGPVGEGHRVMQAEGVDCLPCRSRRCARSPYLECMEKITVDAVVREVASMLREEEGRS